ncbi:cell division protein ZapA [Desulfovibrio sp. ZJ369]|uniref:cell division protein ZapA n=1 Tax=Desulfovibrio sp. ZJ369 TaxID=2709793 RepID=UPI0013EBA017|nr:cell division protein ZapA [Desulfovibrio sp. ZJ369]
MSQGNINLTVLGLEIAFRPGADMERVKRAVRLVEERFADQKLRSHGGQSKDILLTFLALGLADELLQSQKKSADVQNRISSLLSQIEESV